MSHCIDCIHWDEDKADEQGFAPCGEQQNHVLVTVPALGTQRLVARLTNGDDGCSLFKPKSVAPKG